MLPIPIPIFIPYNKNEVSKPEVFGPTGTTYNLLKFLNRIKTVAIIIICIFLAFRFIKTLFNLFCYYNINKSEPDEILRLNISRDKSKFLSIFIIILLFLLMLIIIK